MMGMQACIIAFSVLMTGLLAGCDLLNNDKPIEDETGMDAYITDFRITSPVTVPGVIDHQAGSITVTVPNGTSVNTMEAVFGISEGATASPTSGTTPDLRIPQTITITAEVGAAYVKQYTVTAVLGALHDVEVSGTVDFGMTVLPDMTGIVLNIKAHSDIACTQLAGSGTVDSAGRAWRISISPDLSAVYLKRSVTISGTEYVFVGTQAMNFTGDQTGIGVDFPLGGVWDAATIATMGSYLAALPAVATTNPYRLP